ncbi:aldo-keto reductase MSMEG_2408/MSMEI_2347-like [Antennarius striatus]|uniref:aldo-keto reductase MSMEG_2408/MSMEI_2347-like n=1 Tax=Antennarius striatus TaxID=241820 RepID=UPI0035B10A14
MSSSTPSVLLNTGARMPHLGFGTSKLKAPEDVFRAVDAALASGYRAFDCAAIYENEAQLGQALRSLLPQHNLTRKEVFITSKLNYRHQGGASMEAALLSLTRLDLDYIDLYLIHFPHTYGLSESDQQNPVNRAQSWAALEELHAQGRFKAIGVSNYTPAHLKQLMQHCKVPPALLQVEFHPWLCQKELRSVCEEYDVCFQAFSSLGKGALFTQPILTEVASRNRCTPAQVLLRWAVQQRVPVIPKSANPDRIKENAQIFDFALSAADMKMLTALDCGWRCAMDPTGVA